MEPVAQVLNEDAIAIWVSPETFTDPAEIAERDCFSDEVSAALGVLTGSQRRVLLLCAVNGLSAEEAAQAVGVTVQAARSLLKRAKCSFRRNAPPQRGIPHRFDRVPEK
jgi:DNA-directed RNA polymerase specialized sigma24 family protein